MDINITLNDLAKLLLFNSPKIKVLAFNFKKMDFELQRLTHSKRSCWTMGQSHITGDKLFLLLFYKKCTYVTSISNMVYLEHPACLEVWRWSRTISLYKWFKKLLISRTRSSRISCLSRSIFMVSNPNFTPLIWKCCKISGLFNIPGFITSPINTCSHLHPL
jgi:hypothetical protein